MLNRVNIKSARSPGSVQGMEGSWSNDWVRHTHSWQCFDEHQLTARQTDWKVSYKLMGDSLKNRYGVMGALHLSKTYKAFGLLHRHTTSHAPRLRYICKNP